jgi:hypothetical protein
MAKYRIKYVYERWYDLDIEAENQEEAERMFYSGDYELSGIEPRLMGGELQDSVIIEKLEEASV